MSKLIFVFTFCLSWITARAGVTPTYAPVKAHEVTSRDGIGHTLAKIHAGRTVNVAFLGGSITEMDGWRRLTLEWLRKTYPQATFNEIFAAIGGTGSDLGCFRYGHDVLRHKPDLVFVEFATNDGDLPPETIWRDFDGIVRQTWRHNPETDIVFTYTITASMLKAYAAGICPRAAGAMEMLADYYGIPSIGFGPRVAAEVKRGRLVMSIGELATAVPPSTPDRDRRIAEKLAQEGKTLFAKDGVHPALPGHGFYLESVKCAFREMASLPPVDHRVKMSAPFFDARMENAKMVAPDASMFKGSWAPLPEDDYVQKRFRLFGGTIWRGTKPGDTMSFAFEGTECALYDLMLPRGARVWVTVDGKRGAVPVVRFDRYCYYARLASFPIYRGANGHHTVTLEIDAVQPDRHPVLEMTPNADITSPKYNGTEMCACQIMLVGDLSRQGCPCP